MESAKKKHLEFLPSPWISSQPQQDLHNGATLGLVLAERGGEQFCPAGKV